MLLMMKAYPASLQHMHNTANRPFSFLVPELPEPRPPKPPYQQPATSWLGRFLLRLLAVSSLCMGIAGVIIPGLPTTVFILIAGWAAARSSPKLHHWLWHHRLFGPILVNWSQGGKVSRKAKYSASAMMAICATVLLLTPAPLWLRWFACTCMAGVLAWLWRRPESSP